MKTAGGEGYTARQVCKITGVEYSTLDYWDRSGFIKPGASEATARGVNGCTLS